jgi:hypothetical protein
VLNKESLYLAPAASCIQSFLKVSAATISPQTQYLAFSEEVYAKV